MNIAPLSPLVADATYRTTYEWARLQSFSDWWQVPLLVISCLAILAFVIWMYRRDSVELRPGVGLVLLALRVLALVGVLAYFMELEQRSEQKVVNNSRVLVIADTSLSMGLADSGGAAAPGEENRMAGVIKQIGDGPLVEALRKTHDVDIFRFDNDLKRVATLNKVTGAPGSDAPSVAKSSDPATKVSPAKQPPDWKALLAPQGTETRLGAALRQAILDERFKPLAGVILVTDGGQNAGIDQNAAIELAKSARVPVHTIGVGSDRRPVNVRVGDFVVPNRVYPGDSFVINGLLQGEGLAGKTVTVELTSKQAGRGDNSKDAGHLVQKQQVELLRDGEMTPVRFELPGIDEPGRRTYRLSVTPPLEDRNPADNHQEADLEVIGKKSKVLLIAGGPTREYQFLRNQLRRDKETEVHVLLQTAEEGSVQDAHKVLTAFPKTMAELAEYDTVVGFDPNWTALGPAAVDLLEKWVAEESGGLIVVAGPLYMNDWVQDPRQSKLRSLYPVEFPHRVSRLDDTRSGAEEPAQLKFTREGLEAEFLWIGNNSTESRAVWDLFKGVYGFYQVKGAKPGATVYARYADPRNDQEPQQSVYMAEQFYGSGRVFYIGSGEIWRLRELDDAYYEQLFTKLIRHVTQGRLLRGSRIGSLLVERDRYVLGNTVAVRAQLNNIQHQPLTVPQVPLRVFAPDGATQAVKLTPDSSRPGMYGGQFTVTQEGTYRLDLTLEEAPDEPLTRRILVRVPDLERENPQRNDALLGEIANRTGGRYYVGFGAALGKEKLPALVTQLPDRTRETTIVGTPDTAWQQSWMRFLLIGICGCLCLEWLIRRLFRLA